jgi:hypothetical protein
VRVDELGIAFDYDGQVESAESEAILGRIEALHERVEVASAAAENAERKASLQRFAVSLRKTFYDFEPDFFQQNLARIVDDVISGFKGSLELWPALVEIAYLQKRRAGLPLLRVNNPRRKPGGERLVA